MTDLPIRRLPEKSKRFHNSTGKPTDEFHDWIDGVHRSLLRLGDPGQRSSSGGSSVDLASTTEQLTGTDAAKATTSDSVAALWEKGSDVASAGTISLGEGGFFHITGTTTITDIDFATDKAGRTAWVEFTGILTLTHNASTLILPTGANITTAAGDTACFISEGADAVRCVAYQRADGGTISANLKLGQLTFIFDGAGADIAVGTTFDLPVEYACDVIAWTILGDGGTSIGIDLRRTTYANYDNSATHPAAGDSMVGGGTAPNISGSAVKNRDTSPDWDDISIAADDIMQAYVTACTGIQKARLVLKVSKTQ